MGLNRKLTTQSLILAALTALVGVVGWTGSTTMHGHMNTVFDHSKNGVEVMQDLYIDVLNLRVALLKHGLWDDLPSKQGFEKDFENAYQSLKVRLDAFGSRELPPEARAMFDTLSRGVEDYYREGKGSYLPVSRALDRAEMTRILNGTMLTIYNESFKEPLARLKSLEEAAADEAHGIAESESIAVITGIAACVLAGILLSLGLAWVVGRSISKPVRSLVESLNEATSQISVSSTQLAGAAQEIARGASEQASQIEETSAAMEELSSMVRQNVENAQSASNLAVSSLDASREGQTHMLRMEEAMSSISSATDQIQEVISLIEDIAGQTKMLALNAAVEAARAGEAGLGFAVVADEVKNLANRTAQSSKDTARMIRSTLAKIQEGTTLTRELARTFQGILHNSGQVRDMTREVEEAGRQQDEGIGQVNKAIIEFDTVVQNNAGNAEETASAAEELQGQVVNLHEAIGSLHRLVEGHGGSLRAPSPAMPARTANAPRNSAPSGFSGNTPGRTGSSVSGRSSLPHAIQGSRPVLDRPVMAGGHVSFETDEEFV